jgi:type IV pilus assembly protein PilM
MAIKLSMLTFIKNKDSFALDFGTSSIKFLYLKKNGTRYAIAKWGLVPVGESGAELSPEDRKNIAVARVAEFIAKEKISTKNVISSVSGNQVIVRYVHLPKLSREELAKTIQFEAEPYIPFDIREVDISFHVIGEIVEEGQKKMDTILVAAKKELIQSRLDILNDLNLRPIVVDVDAFALQNAFELSGATAENETVLLVNIGSSVTNMAIIEHGIARVVRDVYISGSSFSKAVQRSLTVDAKTAEDLKTRYAILVTAEEKEKTLAENQKEALQVSSALTPVAKDLLAEIQRSIDFYISQNPERAIHRVFITGGSANLKNLDQFLHQELKLPVEIFNPLKGFSGGDAVPPEIAVQFAVAAGLGARYENDVPKK